ncbi:hypothetical protein LTR85_000763 [Meristemomyces frigidus]|nr:hypothetical protein LTR85_000763 [Meristemomyces frigidus]
MFSGLLPVRCAADGRLHSGPPPWVHPANPFAEPPTGTPKNGTRTARPAVVNPNQQLQTPPASQPDPAGAHSPVQSANTTPRESLSPTPALSLDRFEKAVSPQVVIQVTPAAKTLLAPTPAAPLRPLYQVDPAEDQFLDFDPITPAPAPGSRTSKFPSLVSRTATDMFALQNPPAFAFSSGNRHRLSLGTGSPAFTNFVPETPLEQQRANDALAMHHRRQIIAERERDRRLDRGSLAPSSNNTNNALEIEIENLRAQRAHLVEQLKDMTALADRQRLRKQIAELDAQHERVVAENAAKASDAKTTAAERRSAWWRSGCLVALAVVGFGLYGGWCHYSSVGTAYGRQRECKMYGMPADC